MRPYSFSDIGPSGELKSPISWVLGIAAKAMLPHQQCRNDKPCENSHDQDSDLIFTIFLEEGIEDSSMTALLDQMMSLVNF